MMLWSMKRKMSGVGREVARAAMRWLAVLGLVGALAACVGSGLGHERDYFPGGSPYYSFGKSQSAENFANVKRAQTALGIYANERMWIDTKPGIAPARVAMIQYYFPFSVRWELKDGRQFLLENIDVRTIMREHFRDPKNDLVLPWQREGRPQSFGDMDPSLVYEIRDDVVRLKWLLMVNRTPVDQRILPSGATARWDVVREEYLVKEIPGKPVQGIDFEQEWELRPGINRGK
ncbi:MAG: hypothetical protein WDA10_15615 [Porticoccaceae bacterium]